MTEVVLAEDGGRALREAENFCWRHHVAIVAAEHVLAGALVVLAQQGVPGLATRENIEAAVVACVGQGSEPLSDNVMFGSAARAVVTAAAAGVRRAGETDLGAADLALAAIDSGEVGPMFYRALGMTRNALRQRLSDARQASS